jgi:hypothetical protein
MNRRLAETMLFGGTDPVLPCFSLSSNRQPEHRLMRLRTCLKVLHGDDGKGEKEGKDSDKSNIGENHNHNQIHNVFFNDSSREYTNSNSKSNSNSNSNSQSNTKSTVHRRFWEVLPLHIFSERRGRCALPRALPQHPSPAADSDGWFSILDLDKKLCNHVFYLISKISNMI